MLCTTVGVVGGDLLISDGTGVCDQTVTVISDALAQEFRVDDGEGNTTRIPHADVTGVVRVDLLGGDDTLTVDIQGTLPVALHFNGGAGSNTFSASNESGVYRVDGQDAGVFEPTFSELASNIFFENTQNLVAGVAGSNISRTFIIQGSLSGSIAGLGNADQLSLPDHSLTDLSSLEVSVGGVAVLGGFSGMETVWGNDTGTLLGPSAQATTWEIDWNSSGGGFPEASVSGYDTTFIRYAEFQGGNHDDTFMLGAGLEGLSIDGGGGVNTVVGSQYGAIFETLGADRGVVTTIPSPMAISFDGVSRLEGGPADDQFVLNGGWQGQLDGGGGTNSLIAFGDLDIAALNSSFASIEVAFNAAVLGNGGVGAAVDVRGAIRPGASLGSMTAGSWHLFDSSTTEIEFAGSQNGEYDQLGSSGDVLIDTGATLDLQLLGGFVPQPTQTYTLIDVEAGGSITGHFIGLPEGSVIGGFLDTPYDAEISYQGGDGNDLVLTVRGTPTEVATTTVSLDEQGNLLILDTAGGDSDDSLQLSYDGANDRVVIFDPNLTLESTIPGAVQPNRHTIEVESSLISGSRIRVESLGGSDSVQVLSSLPRPIEWVGGEGLDTLVGGDLGYQFEVTGADQGEVYAWQLTFAEVENLRSGAGNDEFLISETGSLSGTIDGGAGQVDENDNYREGFDGLTIFASGVQEVNLETGQVTDRGNGQVRVGHFVDFESLQAGDLSAADGDVLVGADAPNQWWIDGEGDGRVGDLFFVNFSLLVGGADADQFALTDSGSGVHLDGGAGLDTLTGPSLGATFEIDGVDQGQVGINTATFSRMENLFGGIGDDEFMILEGGGISGTLDGGAGTENEDGDYVEGTDGLTVLQAGGQVFDLEMRQVIDRGTGQIVVGMFNDFEVLAAGDWAGPAGDELVGANQANHWVIDGRGAGRVNDLFFWNFSELTGGGDSDEFEFRSAGRGVHVDGRGGQDTILGNHAGEFYEVNGVNQGNIGLSTGTFADVENLRGGWGNDDFILFDGARMTGTIDGGAGSGDEESSEGTDTLFVASAGSQIFNLQTAQVTDAGTGLVRVGQFENFEAIGAGDYAGPAGDVLIGANVASQWEISGSGDGRVNGLTFVNFSRLEGGTGEDDFAVNAAAAAMQVAGGGGSDSLRGPDLAEFFRITGSQSGQLDVVEIQFEGVESLIGGDADDVFRVESWGPTMQLDGGAGTNQVIVAAGAQLDVAQLSDSFTLLQAEADGRLVGSNDLGAELDLAGSLAPGASPGTLAIADAAFREGSRFELEIGAVGAGAFDRLVVNGDLTIEPGAHLEFSALSGLQLNVGDSLTLLDVTSAKAVAGHFDGLPAGAVLTNFLDSGLNAVIDYSGGDGNDVVLRMVNPNTAPVFTSPATVSIAENQKLVMVVAATDSDLPAQTVTLSITGSGADDHLFELSEDGQLRFLLAPDFESRQDADQNNIYEVEVSADDGAGGYATQTIRITVLNQASITGSVFLDANENGLFDANELGLDGVDVELLDALGNAILDDAGHPLVATTTDGGYLLFDDLDPGTYQLRQIQPSGVDDGQETLGTLGGNIVANDTMELILERTDGQDYQFAELGQQLTSGDTAGIGFWQNKHGQSLIRQGGTPLANWLSQNFGNVFGNIFNDGIGSDDGDEVASYYRNQLFKQKAGFSRGPKVDAQFMATAFSVFFTSSNLAGDIAVSFGFNVTETGIGTKLVNVGDSGAAFGVDDDTELTILQLLLATNEMTDIDNLREGGAGIYDLDGDGLISDFEASLRDQANAVYASINDG